MTHDRSTTQRSAKPYCAARLGVLISSPLPITEPVTTSPGPIWASTPASRVGASRMPEMLAALSSAAISGRSPRGWLFLPSGRRGEAEFTTEVTEDMEKAQREKDVT